jgi:Zn-dependent protease
MKGNIYKNAKVNKERREKTEDCFQMIKGKELLALLLALIVLAFSNSFKSFLENKTSGVFINSLMIFTVILVTYTTAKKFAAYYYDAKEETKIWSFQRYGFYERSYFKYPIPMGIILPFILSMLTFGYIKWFAVTESDVKPKKERAVKRHDIYSFAEMTEWHLALISAAGIVSALILAFIAYLLNLPDLARASIFFACFNMLPLGKLDGTRIFFGSRKAALWVALAIFCLIGLAYAFLLT